MSENNVPGFAPGAGTPEGAPQPAPYTPQNGAYGAPTGAYGTQPNGYAAQPGTPGAQPAPYGAQPAPYGTAPVPAQEPAPKKKGFAGRLVAALAAVGIALLVKIGLPVVLGWSHVQLDDLKPGDCVNYAYVHNDSESSAPIKRTECTKEHDAEVVGTGVAPSSVEYLSRNEFAEGLCVEGFKSTVGKDIWDTELDMAWFTAQIDDWNKGDRTVVCMAFNLEDVKLTQPLREVVK
ncbi:MAG: septum formation family protein [Buchananella hordeovulneris]|nr:septum formation family protein [Buchananella hordeovulneris]